MKRKPWTKKQIKLLRELYPDNSAASIAEKVGHCVRSIYGKTHDLGIKKSEEFLNSASSGRLQRNDYRGGATRFQKGQTSWNKGKKIGSHPNSAKTQFKKGTIPKNKVPVGTEVVNSDGYWKVKIAEPNVWKEKHVLLWNQINGEIPKGKCVVFRDGNRLNCVIENLELISREDLMRRNTIHNLPAELKETIQVLGRLNRQINRRSKTNAEK